MYLIANQMTVGDRAFVQGMVALWRRPKERNKVSQTMPCRVAQLLPESCSALVILGTDEGQPGDVPLEQLRWVQESVSGRLQEEFDAELDGKHDVRLGDRVALPYPWTHALTKHTSKHGEAFGRVVGLLRGMLLVTHMAVLGDKVRTNVPFVLLIESGEYDVAPGPVPTPWSPFKVSGGLDSKLAGQQ